MYTVIPDEKKKKGTLNKTIYSNVWRKTGTRTRTSITKLRSCAY